MNTNNLNKPVAYIVSMRAGLEAFIYREVEALYEKKYKVILYATRYVAGDIYSPKENWQYRTLNLFGLIKSLPVLVIDIMSHPRLVVDAIRDDSLIDLIFAFNFSRRMRKDGVRQIHCHFGDHKFFIGYYCKKLTGLPLSVTIHAHEFYTNPNKKFFMKALGYCDSVFPIANKWVYLLKKEYNVPEHKIKLNRLFVDTDYNSPADEISVLAVGRYTVRKGFQYLIKALKHLDDLNVRVIFIGFGDLDLNNIAEQEGVKDKVTVFGKMDQDQLRYFYRTCDILCVPSITTKDEGAEGIPVVLMEGMSCGMPVVSTSCGAIQELVTDYIVDEHSVNGLVEKIRLLASDKELRRDKGAENRQKVLDDFSVGNIDMFSQWLDDMVD